MFALKKRNFFEFILLFQVAVILIITIQHQKTHAGSSERSIEDSSENSKEHRTKTRTTTIRRGKMTNRP